MTAAKGKVALAGCGLVGASWAIVFARAGHPVRLWDQGAEQTKRAMDAIRQRVLDLESAGLVGSVADVLDLIESTPDLETAVAGAVYIQESITEDPEAKAALFTRLDALADEATVIASSSSAIPGSRFQEHLPGRGRCMIAHPANPPHLLPIVELVPTPWTTEQRAQSCG